MAKPNYRKLAERLQVENTECLHTFCGELVERIHAMKITGPQRVEVEKAVVEHLENALLDVFGLQLAIEDVLTEGEDDE